MEANVNANVGPYLVPLLIVAVVVLRLVRNKPRKVKPNRLFVTPAFVALATALTLSQMGWPSFLWIVADAFAAVAGAGVGYLSARHREFTLDPETGEIMSRATPIGTIIFAALFAARFGLKLAFPGLNGAQSYRPSAMAYGHPAANAIGWTDAGLIFSTALLIATAATTWLRTRHLMEARRAQRAAKSAPPPDANTPA
jgi:hypothetical protein